MANRKQNIVLSYDNLEVSAIESAHYIIPPLLGFVKSFAESMAQQICFKHPKAV